MVASSANAAIAKANAYSRCDPGYCLKYVRTWLDIGSRDASAKEAWENAKHRHPGDTSPPRGAPVFYRGGNYWHIELSASIIRKARGTDMTSRGQVSTQDLMWCTRAWRYEYMGWTEDLNGILIPYLAKGGEQSKFARGDVYVRKLDKGTKDSDSVGRLCYRLRNHSKIPASHRPPRQTDNYTNELLEAVRYWQRNVRPKVPGPDDGKMLSNQQANVLFGPSYDVKEK
jgi:hypothetical protein